MGKDRLSGKVAIVTGSGQGIGEAIALVFADEGASVIVATKTEKNGQETVDQIRANGGKALLCTIDVGDSDKLELIVNSAIKEFGQIDIMVHNAASILSEAVENSNDDNLENVLSVNLKTCFRLSRLCIPHMRKQGTGRLLFTSSVTGPRVAIPGYSYYAASKGGVNGFIKTAAVELARDNITVNGIEPGFILTAALKSATDDEIRKRLAKYIPMGYLGDPKDIAYAMLFLSSEEARYITGQTIIIDGGSTLPESPLFME